MRCRPTTRADRRCREVIARAGRGVYQFEIRQRDGGNGQLRQLRFPEVVCKNPQWGQIKYRGFVARGEKRQKQYRISRAINAHR